MIIYAVKCIFDKILWKIFFFINIFKTKIEIGLYLYIKLFKISFSVTYSKIMKIDEVDSFSDIIKIVLSLNGKIDTSIRYLGDTED